MTDAPGGTPPPVTYSRASGTMDEEAQHSPFIRAAYVSALSQINALRVEVAQLRQERDMYRIGESTTLQEIRLSLAQRTQERDEALTGNEEARTNRLWLESYTRGDQQRADSAEARLAALTEKIAAYEARPWPGCRMLSLGDACDCSLCQSEHKLAALTAVLGDMEQQCRSEIMQTLKNADEQTRLGNRTSATFWAGQASVYAFVADRIAALQTPEGT